MKAKILFQKISVFAAAGHALQSVMYPAEIIFWDYYIMTYILGQNDKIRDLLDLTPY